MHKRRRLAIVFLALALLCLVVLAALTFWADDALRHGIETAGTEVLGVTVTLPDVDLNPLKGQVQARDIVIANPAGFQSSHLLYMKKGMLTLNLPTLAQEQIHIRHLHLDRLDVNLEQRGVHNNLQEVLDRIPEPHEPNYPHTKPFRIDVLDITHVVVRAKLTPWSGDKDVLVFELEPFRMEKLGYDETLDLAILCDKIILALTDAILARSLKNLPAQLLHNANEAIRQVTGIGKTLLDPNGTNGLRSMWQEGMKGLFTPSTQEANDVDREHP